MRVHTHTHTEESGNRSFVALMLFKPVTQVDLSAAHNKIKKTLIVIIKKKKQCFLGPIARWTYWKSNLRLHLMPHTIFMSLKEGRSRD